MNSNTENKGDSEDEGSEEGANEAVEPQEEEGKRDERHPNRIMTEEEIQAEIRQLRIAAENSQRKDKKKRKEQAAKARTRQALGERAINTFHALTYFFFLFGHFSFVFIVQCSHSFVIYIIMKYTSHQRSFCICDMKH